MAGDLMRALLVFAVLAGVCRIGQAEPLPDPTRPFVVPGSSSSGAMVGADAPSLQLVLIRPGQTPKALLNGEWIEQGKLFGDSRLIKVSLDSVILRGPKGTEKLSLTPGVSKELPREAASGAKKP